jgi:hypothetical protein
MTDWTRDPEAAAILARLGANPPPARMRRCEDLTVFYAEAYCGKDVRRLRAIHANIASDILRECDQAGDHTAFSDHCDLTVEKAIERAIIQASRKAAA